MKRYLIAAALVAALGVLASTIAAPHHTGSAARLLVSKVGAAAGALRPAAASAARPAGPALQQEDSRDAVEVSGSGHSQADEALRQYSGDADLLIGGESRHAAVTVTVADSFTPTPDGGQHAATSHRFDFGADDSFTTSERLLLRPGGAAERLEMTSVLTVNSGTGAYANAKGSLALTGSMSADSRTADWNVTGKLEK